MSVAIQFTQNFLGVEPECSQVCKFVKNFRSDLRGVCTAEVEVPCKLVEVGAHFAAPVSYTHLGTTIREISMSTS